MKRLFQNKMSVLQKIFDLQIHHNNYLQDLQEIFTKEFKEVFC